ncbi:MAG: SUMF1/EgtB/PvdO family nonheme iron enzyme [Acidobacteriota bacterium]|nr:SUMF1/EgtB/PvdO family nonheme iron enzyme [Acidobacteriota bacterium]
MAANTLRPQAPAVHDVGNARETPEHDPAGEVARACALLEETRAGTLSLVAHLSPAELEAAHSPIMGPLVWDLAHIAAYQDLWLVHRHGGRPLLRPDLADLYDAFETPRSARNHGPAGLLDVPAAHDYLAATHRRSCEVIEDAGLADRTLFELVLRHELQHRETMRQTMSLAGLLPEGEPPTLAIGGTGPTGRVTATERQGENGTGTRAGVEDGDGARWADVAAGPHLVGAGPAGFAYDNERPRWVADLDAFQIATTPLANHDWQRFHEAGGYAHGDHWSSDGWTWLRKQPAADLEARMDALSRSAQAQPTSCLSHISFFEADAIARSRGARLPSEAEWEKARSLPHTLDATGLVWEWTASEFSAYPGFRAHPYREYSEVFFDRGYRVLRGSSWATHPRIATPTFRNWDLPQRSQIFAGARLARDL